MSHEMKRPERTSPPWIAVFNDQEGHYEVRPQSHKGNDTWALAIIKNHAESNKPNANLIAAAPELLEALKDLIKYTDKMDAIYTHRGMGADELGKGAPTESARGRAIGVIKKATGRRPVKIHDMDSGGTYTASNELDCRDATDLAAYEECVKLNSVITMGRTIAEPIS